MIKFNIDTTEYILENEYKNNNKITILLNKFNNIKLSDKNFNYIINELEKQLEYTNILDKKIFMITNKLS